MPFERVWSANLRAVDGTGPIPGHRFANHVHPHLERLRAVENIGTWIVGVIRRHDFAEYGGRGEPLSVYVFADDDDDDYFSKLGGKPQAAATGAPRVAGQLEENVDAANVHETR